MGDFGNPLRFKPLTSPPFNDIVRSGTSYVLYTSKPINIASKKGKINRRDNTIVPCLNIFARSSAVIPISCSSSSPGLGGPNLPNNSVSSAFSSTVLARRQQQLDLKCYFIDVFLIF